MLFQKISRRLMAFAVILFFSLPPASANPYQLDPRVDQELRLALEKNYNLDYDGALAILSSLEKEKKNHPVVAFTETLTLWWRMTARVLEEDPKAGAPFIESAKKTIRLAEEKIKSGDPEAEGRMVKGAVLGLIGRWHIKNRRWLKAYRTGKKAKKFLSRAAEKNPGLTDAFSGIGVYDYFIAKLPGLVRFLAFLGQTGDPKVGIEEIKKGIEGGGYTETGAKLALTFIYIRNEKDPAKALELTRNLLEVYPHSPFIRALHAIALYDSGDQEALEKEARAQETLLKNGSFPADFKGQVNFFLGTIHFKLKNWPEAKRYYTLGAKEGNRNDPFRTWSRLHLGFIADAEGKRDVAKKIYKAVRGETNRWGTRRLAKYFLRHPFTGSKEELDRLLLDFGL